MMISRMVIQLLDHNTPLPAQPTSRSQIAVGLLKRSPVILPIPGTSKVAHLEENVAAAEIELFVEEFEILSRAGAA